MAHLYLTRHPKCILNELGRYQGTSDSPPSPLGKRQIAAFLKRMEGVPLDLVIVGPKPRHHSLGDLVAKTAGCVVREEPLLEEVDYGEWECLTEEESRQKTPKKWEEFMIKERDVESDFVFPEGGSYAELRMRVNQLLNIIPWSSNILIVTSNVTARVIILRLSGRGMVPAHIPQCSLTEWVGGPNHHSLLRLVEQDFLK